jgi:23S rRNA pseudouridine1911/1915/1917 synthase
VTRSVAFTATMDESGSRLDLAVARHLDRSRTASAALIRDGCVRVNGSAEKSSYVLADGDRVDVVLPPDSAPAALPERIPIAIVYADADICVVDKPAGMATHPAPGSARGTLVNALLAALGPLPAINGVLRPGIVHRLDKDTSGLLVVAVSERAMRGLSEAMARREIQREYDALVHGKIAQASGTVDAPIGRDPEDRTRFAVRDEGRRAVTHFRVAEVFGRPGSSTDVTFLQVRLETGRTHQIRVHCAAIGHPIVGDRTYGAGRDNLGMRRQALHAARLRFAHPVSGESLSFTSPWPADFAALVSRLRAERAG